jgi:hypothetical protein
MSKYPGPEYLVMGEYGECEHGAPDDQLCAYCLRAELDQAKAEADRVARALNRVASANKALSQAADSNFLAVQRMRETMEEVAMELIALAKYHYGDDSEIFVSPARDHLRSLATKLTGGNQ